MWYRAKDIQKEIWATLVKARFNKRGRAELIRVFGALLDPLGFQDRLDQVLSDLHRIQ